jgi:saccharopine dehydrogenase-like NADP-dependent oxidoreductase
MKKVTILGAGMVGSAIAFDLAKNFRVKSVDFDDNKLMKVKDYGVEIQILDLKRDENIKSAIADSDLVVNALPGFMGFKSLKAIIESKKNVVDIAFFPEDAFDLDELAKENGVTAIVDFGVAPGMSNFILGYYNNIMDVHAFKCYVGGLPKERTFPFQYKAPFSPIDVIEEYTRPARYIEDGKMVTKAPMTDPEFLEFDGLGSLEAFNTDGLRSILRTMTIPNMIEKTLRYPGHIDLIKSLRDMGFLSENKIKINGNEIKIIDFTANLLFDKWFLHEYDEEFTVMKIIVEGKDKREYKKYTYNLFDKTDTVNKISSMSRTTGFSCTAALNLLSEGRYINPGINPPEYVANSKENFHFVMNYLKARGIKYNFEIE